MDLNTFVSDQLSTIMNKGNNSRSTQRMKHHEIAINHIVL